MDIVYALGTGSHWDDNELRYSLRSIEKFLTGYDDIYIVGHCPHWVRNVLVLPFSDTPDRKEYSIASKVLVACGTKQISNNFIYMADDYVLLTEIDVREIHPYHIGQASAMYETKTGRNKEKAANLITAYPESLFYDIHQPFPYSKATFISVMKQLDWESRIYPLKSIYMAVAGIKKDHQYVSCDFKIKYPLTYSEIVQDIETRMYTEHNYSFAHGPKSLNDDMKRYLQHLLPHKSKFEK